MTEGLKQRFEFPSYLIQAQAVRSLVAAVLKEKGQNEKIGQSSAQSPALEALWEQCCSESPLVRSACCDALVLFVEQGHADLQHTLNSILNLLPSARNVQGLITVTSRLLQLQLSQGDRGAAFTCPYSIRSFPHPFISLLENRADCWPFLLQEIQEYLQQATLRGEVEYVSMLAPFLRYLYCEPQRLPEHALLRHSLLKVLLPAPEGPVLGPGSLVPPPGGPLPVQGSLVPPPGGPLPLAKEGPSMEVTCSVVRCLLELVPHMQVDSVAAVLELSGLVEVLFPVMMQDSGLWSRELSLLAMHLLCASQLCLGLGGDCRPLLHSLQRLLPTCAQVVPLDQVLMGVSVLLLHAPASQQTALLELAVCVLGVCVEPPVGGGGVLRLPLLQVLSCCSLMEALSDPHTRCTNQNLAQQLLDTLQDQNLRATPSQMPVFEILPLSVWHSELAVACRTLRRISGVAEATVEWLHSVGSALPLSERVPDTLPLLLTHAIVCHHGDVCRLALETVATLARADPTQVPSVLPVLMYKLGRVSDPALSQSLLYTLPKLATHKLCVPQVLHVLQTLSSAPKLRAVVLRLMTALWEKQDRVYPDLQRLMGVLEKTAGLLGREAQWEQVLARAACIRDVCRERPYQHGGDMLAAITHTLTQCTRKDQATPTALALQGLQELCRAEVVDIGSTWKALSPQLSCDTRPLVLKATAELLSLLPQLAVKTEEYEKLKEQVVSVLWGYALSQDPEVARCGYKALSEFSEGCHVILHLPEKARPEKMQPDSEDEQSRETEREEDVSVPGASYIKLLGHTPLAVLPALELFLTGLVRQEMSVMPRGVYHSALRRGNLRSDQGKTLAGVPAFMLKTYEKNKQPGLKPGLSAGLLLCFDLPIQTDRDGRPISRFLVSRGRNYQQMLAALIHEVNIQPSEWHRSLLRPQAWRGFMSRAYHAVLQGRKAELEMQQKQGKESPEELQYKQHCAWLWVRDQLTDVVKSAAKESPVVQGNSILALSSLAAVLTKYESNLPADTEGGLGAGPEILPTAHWLAMVIDTLLSIVSSSYRPKGQVFPWFLHRSYSGENTASVIARSCAALGLTLLVPVLVTYQREGLPAILALLRAALPGQPAADESQALQFHTGLALGMLLAALQEERISDVSGQCMSELLSSSLDALEACCFDPSLEYNAGCVLGTGLALCALGGEQQARLQLSLDKMLSGLQEASEQQGRMSQEVLAYSVACVCVSGFSSGQVSAGKAEEIMSTLRNMTEESQQTPGFALALGVAVHGLSSCGHGKAEDIQPRLLAAWTKILLAEGCPTMQRLAALNGLVALVGSEDALIQLRSEQEQSSQQQGRLNEVIRSITQVISFSGALGLQSNGACLVGHLHLAHMSSSHTRTAVPQDFSYLPEKSVIRAAVDYLTEAGKKGPEVMTPEPVKIALCSLAAVGTTVQYPPINWNVFLSPLMRLNFGEEVQHHCIELAASQAQSSQSASLFLGVWLAPPLVHSLSVRTRAHLYECVGSWMRHVTDDKLQVYVDTLGVQQFTPDLRPQRLTLCRAVLRGLASAMALPNPPQACWATLCSVTEKIYTLLPCHIQDADVELYEGVAKCLSEMSDSEIDRIATVTEASVEKAPFTLALLASQGRVPLLGLNDVINATLRLANKDRVGWLLLQCLYQSRFASGPNTGVAKRMEWLLELMGHIRNVAYGATTVKCDSITEATDFLFGVFSAALVSWADLSMPLLLGVRAQWFPWKQSAVQAGLPHALYGAPSAQEHVLQLCQMALPHCMPQLLGKEPWKAQSQKFIDWLFSMAEAPATGLSDHTIFSAKAALLSLKGTPEFKKKGVWTRAYGW
ncbi:focadhesin [Clupea harengus]|uniref:Focadhesin n=1 Tax=Clupea harengus TaxID=7950 RepID=A0A6P8GP33_CLUHA|nr:focadhesin [Clupea harengus]XP_031440498.1 focadhesin [Clupea harengus]